MHKIIKEKLELMTIDNEKYIGYPNIIKCNRLQNRNNKIKGGQNDF